MKNSLTIKLIFSSSVTLIATLSSCNNESKKQEPAESVLSVSSTASPIDGAWDLVWAKYNDTVAVIRKSSQFKHFSNGFFSLLAWDSSGKFDFGGYGKFELEGTRYKETFIYHNVPAYAGAIDWQEYVLKGDTLYCRGFDKVEIGGKDVLQDFPKIEEKRVRAK